MGGTTLLLLVTAMAGQSDGLQKSLLNHPSDAYIPPPVIIDEMARRFRRGPLAMRRLPNTRSIAPTSYQAPAELPIEGFTVPPRSHVGLAPVVPIENLAVAGPTIIEDHTCASCEASSTVGHSACGIWGLVGLPSPHHVVVDMPGHIAYSVYSNSHYYFRPYNYFHVTHQQQEALSVGGDARNPYDNRSFEAIYDRFADPFAGDEPEEVAAPFETP